MYLGKNAYWEMVKPLKDIVIIGAGNVATHIANTLKNNAKIIQVYSRHLNNAHQLAQQISSECQYTDNVNDLCVADLYLISIKDDAISEFLKTIPEQLRDSYWAHTSGSVPRDVFNGFNNKNGVIYPLQTFSKEVKVNVEEVAIFVEGNNTDVENQLIRYATLISKSVYKADSQLRQQLHVAAVFANNFSNYMYIIANDILKRNNLPFSVLSPLIKETTRKATSIPPLEAQTGPAVRGDLNVMNKHLSLLNTEESNIYDIVSQSILKRFKK